MKKASEYRYLEAFVVRNGRCERIRTFYPLHPMELTTDRNGQHWIKNINKII